MRPIAAIRASSRSSLLQVIKTSIAVILAWVICTVALGQPLPIFAAIAALLVVQPSVNQSLARGLERSVGVVAGVILAYLVGLVFPDTSWIVLGIIVLSLLLAWALRLTPGSANQVPISAMLVLAIGSQTPEYSAFRIIETVIGAAVALLVNVAIVPPVLLAPAHRAITALANGVASTLEALSTSLRSRQTPDQLAALLSDARGLRELRDAANDSVSRAEESLMLNPRGGRHRRILDHDLQFLSSLTALISQVLGMARAVHDHYDDGLNADPTVRSISIELERAAHDLRLLAREPATKRDTEANPITAELPALTAPLVVAKPDAENWILIGSLLEDLRRVRAGIIGSPE
jgi:uncharacterized membrane protein YccC